MHSSSRAAVLSLVVACGSEHGHEGGADAGEVQHVLPGSDASLRPADAGRVDARIDVGADAAAHSTAHDDAATAAGSDGGHDPAKASSCTGQPDMTLCNVVTSPDRWYDVCVSETCVSPGCDERSCNTPGPHFRLAPFSSAGMLTKRPGQEPVTIDGITGLHWQSCAAGLSGADCAQGMALELDLPGALAYCDASSWAGFDDWYLPDMHELVSLVDTSVADSVNGALSEVAFPNRAATVGNFWSTSTQDERIAYLLFTDKRQVTTGFPTDTSLPRPVAVDALRADLDNVLCVRRGDSHPMPAGDRLIGHDGVEYKYLWAEDRVTGLGLQACSSVANAPDCAMNAGYSEAAASTHCEQLVWAGLDDWRLPSYPELQAFFRYGKGFDYHYLTLSSDEQRIVGGRVFDSSFSTVSGASPADEWWVNCVRGP